MSLGRLAVGEPAFAPATARAVIELLDHHQIPISGRHVAVVGRSAVVGKPLLHLLLQRDATVTICHSRSTPLDQFTKPADIVAVAVGRPGMLTADHVSTDAVVIDVGTNVLSDGSLVGDADQESVSTVAAALSPVPRRGRLGDDRAPAAAHRRRGPGSARELRTRPVCLLHCITPHFSGPRPTYCGRGSRKVGREQSRAEGQRRSNRSSSMTLVQAATKSFTNFSRASWLA